MEASAAAMSTISVHDADQDWARLLARVTRGEEVIIYREGRPVARLLPLGPAATRRSPGSAAGQVVIRDDIDAPLPDDVLELFQA